MILACALWTYSACLRVVGAMAILVPLIQGGRVRPSFNIQHRKGHGPLSMGFCFVSELFCRIGPLGSGDLVVFLSSSMGSEERFRMHDLVSCLAYYGNMFQGSYIPELSDSQVCVRCSGGYADVLWYFKYQTGERRLRRSRLC